MKNENREILGFNVPIIGIVETLDEAISASGSKEAVLKDFNNNVLAHSHFGVVRRIVVATLEKATGVARIKNDKGAMVEKDAEYVARLETELGEAGLKAYEAAVADAVGKVAVDYTPGTRGQGSSTATPAKKWLAYYDQLVVEEKLEAFCNKHGIKTDGDEAELRVAVALKVKEIVTEKEKAIAKTALDV